MYEVKTLGDELIPNQQSNSVTINSLGFRGDEFSPEKPDNVYRIFMLGGSTMFGHGATSDQTTIPGYTQEFFQNHDVEFKIEIINGGIVLGGILLLVMGFFDIIDGAVAKATNSVSLKGAFIDSNSDRISEILIFIGIFQSGLVNPNIVLLALSGSLMVSYVRAKSEAMNIQVSGLGIGAVSYTHLTLPTNREV